uniref:Uncharacterized protein n=1 Tax=Picea sitchensis TaxID=3332 RepID=A9NYC3_PICSI|nr:unknown [Picea sitchensis]
MLPACPTSSVNVTGLSCLSCPIDQPRNYWYLKWNGLLLIKLMKTFGGIESRLRKYCFYLTKEIGQ